MSGGLALPESLCDTERASVVAFELMSARVIKEQLAVCAVTEPKSYVDNRPAPNGISDLRMGSTDAEFTCETCHMAHPHCPGHFGYLELAEPLFNIAVFDITVQVLRCVCTSCGALLVDPSDPAAREAMSKSGHNRLREYVKISQGRRICGGRAANEEENNAAGAAFNDVAPPEDALALGKGCGAIQRRISRPMGIYPKLVLETLVAEQIVRWVGEDVFKVFDKISDRDAITLGFDPSRTHPRDLLIRVLPVPPPQVRPTVSFGSARSDNELSHKLISIIKQNIKLQSEKEAGASREGIHDVREILQEHVATYFHNSSTFYKPAKLTQNANLKSISERLKGKHGRIRGYLMGKRVDFSARTVITGDPNLDVDEVGVPFSVAMTLTVPERVCAANKKRLLEAVRCPGYPGANYIIHNAGGVMKRLQFVKDRSKLELQIGDIVERHVLNGDAVLFNRQPTLHRMSMMGHRVRVLPFNTFRLNLSCTTPYNADFDGDEMNLHVPQSLLTKAELQEMMMVPKNFVSPNKSAPCMGIVQDSLLGCFKLTDKETFLDKHFVQNMVMWVDRWTELPVPAIVKPYPLWTGKQIFSLALPEVNMTSLDNKEKYFSNSDTTLIIRRGELITGMIKKSIVGASAGSLINVVFNEKGSDEVARFINFVQRITAHFLYYTAFSVGVQDTVADRATLDHINQVLKRTRKRVSQIASKANEGSLKRKTGMTLLQSFEKEVNTELNKCREDAAKEALKNVRRTNSFKCMIECGSKGSDLNICQITAMVGQQNVNGSRISFGFRRRTLPHFMQDDYGEESRGMVNRGYLEGLTPPEFYFHTMGGREGLIDTAVKTADTGYLQRKLIKALEDIHAAYDGTVRNSHQEVVQLIYGEDGLDGSKIEQNQTVDLMWQSNKDMANRYRFEYSNDGTISEEFGGTYLAPDVKRAMRSNPREAVEKMEKEFQQLMTDRDDARRLIELSKAPIKLSLPVNVDRLISNAKAMFEVGRTSKPSTLTPTHVIESVQRLISELQQFHPSHGRKGPSQYTNELNRQRLADATRLFSMHLRASLASKIVVNQHRLTQKSFEFLLGEIRLRYMQSVVQPGEMIGAIAAQSCGEPATQMTLNTFHNAGISSKNVTLGVPRLQELLNVSRTQKNSSMLIALDAEHSDKRNCEKAVHLVEYCTMETVTRRMMIVYDPDVANSIVEEDRQFVADDWDDELCTAEEVEAREHWKRTASPWVVRLLLDNNVINEKSIGMTFIKSAIREHQGIGQKYIVEVSLKQPYIVRLRLKEEPVAADGSATADIVSLLKNEVHQLLSSLRLMGIEGVKKVMTTEFLHFPVNPETGAMSGDGDKKYRLDTEGTALRLVWANVLSARGVPIVDHTQTDSNNIPEIYRILGLEAARKKLFLEMRAAYQAYGVVINYRHYSVLVDAMCHNGYLMAVNRTGINRSTAGALMRCSFEETVKVLMGAATFAETDPVQGVSANIMLGNQARIGTGLFDLVLHHQSLLNAIDQKQALGAPTQVNMYHTPSSVGRYGPAATATGLDDGASKLTGPAGSLARGSAFSSLYYPNIEGRDVFSDVPSPAPTSDFHPASRPRSPLGSGRYPAGTGGSAAPSAAYSNLMPSSHYEPTRSLLPPDWSGAGAGASTAGGFFDLSSASYPGGAAPAGPVRLSSSPAMYQSTAYASAAASNAGGRSSRYAARGAAATGSTGVLPRPASSYASETSASHSVGERSSHYGGGRAGAPGGSPLYVPQTPPGGQASAPHSLTSHDFSPAYQPPPAR